MAKLDDLIQQKQQRDEDWKAKKTAEREELGQLSDDAVMHVTSEPGAYLHYLDTQAINPRYSASNVMLAMAQNPEITYINSLEVWNRLGRSVNRDENGMKIRVSESDLMLTLMDCLGAAGVGLPFNDTYSSIQTNVVDGAENNMTSYIEMSFWEVAPYWTYDGHSYMPDMILASKQTMDKLSAEDQQIIFDCAKEAEVWHREAWEESEAKNAKIAEEKGCTLTTLTDEEVKLFQDAVAPMYDTFLNADQKAIVERVQALG